MITSVLQVVLFGASLANAGVTVWFDVPEKPSARAEAKLQKAESTLQQLLGDSLQKKTESTDKGTRVSYRATAWAISVEGGDGKALWQGLKSSWGADMGYVEDAAADQAAAGSRPSKLGKAARAKLLSGNDFDGALSRAGGVAGPAANAAPGLKPGAAGKPEAPAKKSVDLASIDPKANPCDDFFQYACGSWVKNNPIPGDQPKWGTFNELAERNKKVLREILEKAAKLKGQRTAIEKQMGDFYAACMDTKRAKKNGIGPIKPALARVDAIGSKKDLAAAVAELHKSGMATDERGGNKSVLFQFAPTQDYQDASQMIAAVDQGGIALPDRDYYLTEKYAEVLKAYRAHVQKMFELAGEKPEAAADSARAVLAIEAALARNSMDKEHRREPANVHNKVTVAELQAMTPSFDWSRYLSGIGAPAIAALDLNDTGFFKGLEAVLRSAPLESWKSYLRFKVVSANAGLLSPEFFDAKFDFFGKTLAGVKRAPARWKRCVSLADGAIGDAVGKAYVEKAFPGDAKKQALEIIQQVQAAMKTDIEGLGWMSEETKLRALEKLAAVTNKIGYPDKWKDYSTLSVRRDDAVGNVERAANFEFALDVAKIGKPVDKGDWHMTPPTVNAYYDPGNNDENFPAGILQPPFFTAGGDRAVNYGGFGAVAGHELTHGFDDEGRHYDGKGNLKDWWAAKDGVAFEKNAKGLIDEYSNFIIQKDPKDPSKDVKVNGKLTLGENVADNGGLRLAYMAMQSHLTPEERRPLNGFTPEQRFFLGFGQVWCGQARPETERVLAVSDPHSPGKFRVNGTVANMPEFASAFSCGPNSGLTKGPRNRVW